MPRLATVWCGEARVGTLREDDRGRIHLAYDRDWVDGGFAISLSLPLTPDEQEAHAFFSGLLPEGMARERICRQYRLAATDDLGLLLEIGRDCAGALSVLPPDGEPMDDGEPVVLGADDLALLVESRGQALPEGEERRRFSLAGAQDKVALRIEGSAMYLPRARYPSSHILKFETIRWVCFAEYAACDLARRAGLPVAAVEHRLHGTDGPTPYLCVTRYDRGRDPGGELVRLHQEDIAQAMGYPSSRKYQEDGGPSLAEVARLVRRHCADPAGDIASLRDWVLFNYLAGNSDGHAKNLALVYPLGATVPRLAPCYDLVAIEALNRIGMRFDRKMAFFIGGNNVPERVTRADWGLLARALEVPPRRLLERLRAMAESLPALARDVRADFASAFGDNQVYDRFEESVADRCGWTLRSTDGTSP